MKKSEFKKLLKSKSISFKEKNGIIIINNQGSVYLRSCTSLPEGIQFNNQGSVDLESCTSLPEGIQFNNQGSVGPRKLH